MRWMRQLCSSKTAYMGSTAARKRAFSAAERVVTSTPHSLICFSAQVVYSRVYAALPIAASLASCNSGTRVCSSFKK